MLLPVFDVPIHRVKETCTVEEEYCQHSQHSQPVYVVASFLPNVVRCPHRFASLILQVECEFTW